MVQTGSQIVGCGGIYIEQGQREVGLAWGMIHDDQHGNGFGRLLTQYRIDQMQSDWSEFAKIVRTSQLTVGFYEKMGFRVTGIEKDGWGAGLDRIQMILQSLDR